VGYYLRKYEPKLPWILLFVISVLGNVIATRFVTSKVSFYTLNHFMNEQNGFFSLIGAISLFMMFKNIKISSKWLSKTINWLAASTYGVYLMHDDPYIRQLLWKEWLCNKYWGREQKLWVKAFIICIAIWICCVFIDKAVTLIVKKPIEKFEKWIVDRYKGKFRCT
jgi:hypothetical protein